MILRLLRETGGFYSSFSISIIAHEIIVYEVRDMKNIPVYSPADIETRWQKHWADTHAFEAQASHDKPKFYGLVEFPYPSGAGMHVGHIKTNTQIGRAHV